MSIHPAPPTELPAVIEAYRRTAQAVVDLGRSCNTEDFATPTDCPGWDVHDVIAHVLSVETYLAGAEWPATPEQAAVADHGASSEFTAWMQRGVAAYHDRTGPALVAELSDVVQRRVAHLSAPGLEPGELVRAPLGQQSPLLPLLRLRVADIWVHEQDLREALGRPGELDSPGAATFVDAVFAALPRVVARLTPHLPEGTTVILQNTGPVTGRVGVRLGIDEDGRRTGYPLFSGTSHPEGEAVPGPGAEVSGSATSISLSTEQLTRRAAGRRSTTDTIFQVTGDETVAAAVLENLVITP